jgi:prepilin-type N-terminal cleavage/methylation domain-containing protein
VLEQVTVMKLKRQDGFTIIELMVVVVIAAILLTLAAPSFNDMLQRRRMEGQVSELVTDLQYARSEAVQRNRNVVLVTGGAGTCYTIAAWSTGVGSCDCTASPACTGGPTALKTVTLTNSVTVTNGISFDFEPVRGSLQSATDTTATVTLGSWQVNAVVPAHGRVSSCSPSGSLRGYTSC